MKWTGYVNEMPYGQACTRHLGALIIDVHKRAEKVGGWYEVIRSLYNRYTLEAYPRRSVCYHRNRR